jgi:hypothetical protein
VQTVGVASLPSNDKQQIDRRISALWVLLITWCLTFFNAARFIRTIPIAAFAIGAIVNFIVIAACVNVELLLLPVVNGCEFEGAFWSF